MQNDIIHAAPLGPRVMKAVPMADYRLLLSFTNGEERVFDAKALLPFKVFKPLENKQFFDLVQVAHGTVQWPNDIDYCPDTLYAQSAPVSS